MRPQRYATHLFTGKSKGIMVDTNHTDQDQTLHYNEKESCHSKKIEGPPKDISFCSDGASGEKLLSFVPFNPSKLGSRKRPNWIRRRLDEAGSKTSTKFSKLRPFSSRRSDSQEIRVQSSKSDGVDTSTSWISGETIETKNGSDGNESIDIISYSSTRSSEPSASTESFQMALNSGRKPEEHDYSLLVGQDSLTAQKFSKDVAESERKIPYNNLTELSVNDTQGEKKTTNDNCIGIKPKNNILCSVGQHLESVDSVGTYMDNCSKMARKYIDSCRTRYEELREQCFFDPMTFNLNDSSTMNRVKKAAEQIILPMADGSTTKEDVQYNRVKKKRLHFVDTCDFEIQEFDRDQPPSTTGKCKKLDGHNPSRGVLVKKSDDGDRKESLEDYKSSMDLCPIPFPDIALKERVASLFELLGAPEDLKNCNDLRLSIYCIHSCLSKLLGFLWTAINSGLKENDFLRELLRKSEHQRVIEVSKVKSKEDNFSSLKKVQSDRINELQKTIELYEQERTFFQAQNDEKLASIEKAMKSMTEVVKETFKLKSFQEMRPKSREKIDSLMIFLKDICEYFTSIREQIVLSLKENAKDKRMQSRYEFFTENYPILERENEALKAAVAGYSYLQDIANDRAALINTLRQENSALHHKLEIKSKELDEVLNLYKRGVQKISEMPERGQKKALKFWERICYEETLSLKEEELEDLKSRLGNLGNALREKTNELENAEKKCSSLEKKLATTTDCSHHTHNLERELKDKSIANTAAIQAEYAAHVRKIQNELNLNKSFYEAELQIYRRNYQKTVERALKLAFKAELVVSSLTESKSIASMRALKYFVNKKKSLQKFNELLKSDTFFLSEKMLETRSCIPDGVRNNINENYFVSSSSSQLEDEKSTGKSIDLLTGNKPTIQIT